MSTLKQIAANRLNALKSTGPTTPEGKERSRSNAIRHGLTAETVITKLENAEDYQAFEAAVIADYDAETAVERELVLRLASVLWRLRRATGIETALFKSAAAELANVETGSPPLSLVGSINAPEEDQRHLRGMLRSEALAEDILGLDTNKDIGESFMRLAALPTFPLDRLSRYEYMLWRQARQIVFTLESIRRTTRQTSRPRFHFSFRHGDPRKKE